jgi:hypothetical protein
MSSTSLFAGWLLHRHLYLLSSPASCPLSSSLLPPPCPLSFSPTGCRIDASVFLATASSSSFSAAARRQRRCWHPPRCCCCRRQQLAVAASVAAACFWLVVALKIIIWRLLKATTYFSLFSFLSLDSTPQTMAQSPLTRSPPHAPPLKHLPYQFRQLLVDCWVS